MENVFFGMLAIAAGALFCFRGALAFRVLIPVWGAFVGFASRRRSRRLDDGGKASFKPGSPGSSPSRPPPSSPCWRNLDYEVAVVLAMGSIGFALGASLMVALAIWN